MRMVRKGLIATIVATILTACLAPTNALMTRVDMHSWSKTESIVLQNSDTTSLRDIEIAIRYNHSLKQSALPLKIGITTPDSLYFEEVVKLPLHHPHTALTATMVESVPYRADVLLDKQGAYIFSFEPTEEICGVEAIGIEFREKQNEDGKR